MKMEVPMRGQALLMAGVMAVSAFAVTPASAQPNSYQYQGGYQGQDYLAEQCQKQQRDRMVAGGAMGAIAGAVLGSNVAGHGAKSEGGVLGALAGALAGGAIGRSTAKCDAYTGRSTAPYDRYGQDRYNGNSEYDDYGLEGGPYAPASYAYDRSYGRQCGWGEEVLRDPDGRSVRQSVYMCQGRDGQWRPQSR
jgi:hypothetical protein